MRERDPEFDAWIQRAKEVPLDEVATMLTWRYEKRGLEIVGPCPCCGGKEDKLQISTVSGKGWLCRDGAKGIDGVGLVMHCERMEFVPACEFVLNEAPPKRDHKTPPQPINHEAERAAHDARKDREIVAEVKDIETRAKKANRSQEVFDSGKPIRGTWADKYLRMRGIILAPEQAGYLRFIPNHPYYEGADESGKPKVIGYYPAFVALMRDKNGDAVGMHCTYLDSQEPIKAKIEIDNGQGKTIRLNPRKMYGTAGLIWLSPIKPIMAIGEGIETTTSWYALGIGPTDVGIAAAGALGRLSGDAMGTIPHPKLRNRTIPNGIPDPEKPGMPIPDDVRELIFLGDADKNPENTRAHLLTGMRRHASLRRVVSCHMSPLPPTESKWDWNDQLRAIRKQEAA